MFDELRKKISGAVKSFIKKEEKEAASEIGAQVRPPETPQQAGRSEAEHAAAEHKKADEPKLEVGTSIGTKIKGAFLGSVKLSDQEIGAFLEELETSLLQSDVSYSATENFISILRGKLSSWSLFSNLISDFPWPPFDE